MRIRRLWLAIVLGVTALGVFAYVQPVLTIRALANALEVDDPAAIRERMDAERVKQSLGEAYAVRQGGSADASTQSAAVVASLVLFGRGIEMIMATSRTEAGGSEIAEWRYDSLSRVRATLRQDASGPIAVMLERRGMGWQVVAMEPTEAAWRELEQYRARDTAD